MKIKTIRIRLDNAEDFDKALNKALEDGYQLIRRDIVPGFRLSGGGYLPNMLYAELVLPDPPTEPEQIDPFEALRQVKEFCGNIPPHTCEENCPLYRWCEQYAGETDPCSWHLPEVEV